MPLRRCLVLGQRIISHYSTLCRYYILIVYMLYPMRVMLKSYSSGDGMSLSIHLYSLCLTEISNGNAQRNINISIRRKKNMEGVSVPLNGIHVYINIYIYINIYTYIYIYIYTSVKVSGAENTFQRTRVDGADNGKMKWKKWRKKISGQVASPCEGRWRDTVSVPSIYVCVLPQSAI